MSWRGALPAACWNASEASSIIPVEAESTSDGVFLATHSTIPITQRDQVDSARGGAVVDEHALLRAVQDQPADQPIIPILGKSGTGKSHLVRWLRAHLETKDSTRLIFVPKHRMSLRGILELILEHATGDRADELRAKVATAVDAAADEKTAQLKLRNALAVNIETRGNRSDGSAEEIELRTYLASAGGLPALFGDDVFRSRLLDQNGPIARLVREKVSGKADEDKEDAFGFSADDLNLSVDDVNRAGQAAREVAGALTSEPIFRELAARMINEQLGPSVSEVFGIGGDDLKQILTDVRVEMDKQGLELLVLIEDFSIFQGIQGGLIDAITLISTETQKLCPMRVVMAVTTGYFVNQMPETVYTRTYRVFDLDLPDGIAASFTPARFVSRYLNAVRVGAADLDAAHASDGELPNACEQCPVSAACHASFGEADGYGLFPFNTASLDRAIQSQSSDGSFVARNVLTRVLRPVLHRDQEEINNGRFPSDGFASEFRTGADDRLANIEDQVKLQAPGDDELTQRRVRMVRFWGTGSGAENLAPTIHAAFSVPPVDGLTEVTPDPRVPTPGPTPAPGAAPTPTPQPTAVEPTLVKAVDRWLATQEILQRDRNDLRNIIFNAVRARLGFEDGFGGDSLWGNDKALAPGFEATSVEFNQAKLATAVLPMDRSNAVDMRALRALAWAHHKGSWADVPDGEMLQRLTETRVEHWVSMVGAALLPPERPDEDFELIRLVETLLAISQALGIADAFKSDAASKVRALFAAVPPRPEPDPRTALRALHNLLMNGAGAGSNMTRVGRGQLQQRLLRHASYSQGAGKPLALDLSKVTKAVRSSPTGVSWPKSTPELIKASVSTVEARLASFDALHQEAVNLVPDLSDLGGDLPVVAAELLALVNERGAAGGLPGGINPADLQAAARAVKPGDQRKVETVFAELNRWDQLSTEERYQVLNGDWDEPARRVNVWLKLATQAVRFLENSLGNGAASDVQREYAEARDQLIDELTAMADTIAGAAAPESEPEETA
ncbi:protein DpdH [Nocardioides sp. W7]|uniref:protein DpdH n=1 Tax=Nocardioides sp. W7 TaxID=2931390 RepID=UPI002468919C|nr:protein DpdH [Nocardioides sp. W7]